MLKFVCQIADNHTVDFKMTQAMEPFLAHKSDKIDVKILTLAQFGLVVLDLYSDI